MSNLLSIYVISLVVFSILLYSLIIYFTKDIEVNHENNSDHSFDGIQELNKPLPEWWLWIFMASIIFALIYLLLYPGLGKFDGFLLWTSHRECDEQILRDDKKYQALYFDYSKETVESLSNDPKVVKIGRKLFLNYCSSCHGFDANGGFGFPSLVNNKWLYGGSPDEIKTTITNGRSGKMPSYSHIFNQNDDEIHAVVFYVLSLSNPYVYGELAEKGKLKFSLICSACHGANAKGNKFIGAPDLIDPQWIHGGKIEDIISTIKNGRRGIMPSHKDLLSKEQIHILTAYIYSLNKI